MELVYSGLHGISRLENRDKRYASITNVQKYNTQLKTPTQYSAGAQYQDPIPLNEEVG